MSIEAFISTLRLPKILGIEKFEISKRNINAALKADINDVVDSALRLEVTDMMKSDIKRSDLPAIKEQLYNLDLTTLMPEMLPKITAAGGSADVAMRIIEILNYLKDNLPQSEYDMTVTGLRKTQEASTSANTKFLWRCRLADNPYHLFELFAKMSITDFDVKAVQAMFPDLYKQIVESVIANMVKLYPSDSMIPRAVKNSVSVLLQAPIMTLEQLNAYKKSEQSSQPSPMQNQAPAPKIAQMETNKE